MVFVASFFVVVGVSNNALAATFTVNVSDNSLIGNSSADPTPDGTCSEGSDVDNDCSLREAIIAANLSVDDDLIFLPEDTITLQLTGAGENSAATGDLDVMSAGTLTITGAGESLTTLNGNDIDSIFDLGNGATLTMSEFTITGGNSFASGGAIYSRGILNLTSMTISDSTASNSGGGLYVDAVAGTTTLTDVLFSSNTAFNGAAIHGNADIMLISSTISDNAGVNSGAIRMESGTLTIDNSTISSNTATGTGINSNGGALYIAEDAMLTMDSVLLNQNAADGEGGALFISCSSQSNTITNSVFVDNSAGTNGGAISNGCSDESATLSSSLTITFSTITGNAAASAGGALYARQSDDDTATISVGSSIVSDNTAVLSGPNCAFSEAGMITSGGYNVLSDDSCSFSGTGDIVDDPLLSTDGLADNGGEIQTIALQATSPALDISPIENCVDTIDARGILRPNQDACDAGAFELEQVDVPEDTDDEEEVEPEPEPEAEPEPEPTAEEIRQTLTSADDLSDDSTYGTQVASIEGGAEGNIIVNYTDDTQSTYAIFPAFTGSKETTVKQYGDTGYLIVLHPRGKKIALVNAYTGEVIERVRLSTSRYKNNSFKILDVRHDDQLDIVVTSKKSGKVLVSLLKLKVSTANLTLKDAEEIATDADVKVKKTRAPKKRINLRDADGNVLYTLKVNSSYQMTLQ